MNDIQRKEFEKIKRIKEITPEIADWFFDKKRYSRCFKDMERAEKMCRMRLQGKSYKEIASVFGKSASVPSATVQKVMRIYRSEKCRELTRRKPSNKERIQSMSTEELANFLLAVDNICFEICEKAGDKYGCPFGEIISKENCVECHIKYLESEVKER